MRGGGPGLLLLDGRVVLRDHAGVEHEERLPAAEPVPAGGAGVFRANDRAEAGGGEDSQSEDAVAAESRGAEAADAGGHEGDGGPGRGSGIAGGIVGDRRECGADVLRGVCRDDEAGRGRGTSPLPFEMDGRNRRPPRDPVNAMLSLGYSLLAKDLTVACYAVGFDPYVGFYHQPRFGRPALALDLMEPFRALIVDSAVLTAVNTGMVTARDFVRAGGAVALTAGGRKAFFRAYEMRMDALVTHPLFEYRVSYRRLLEIQSRLLARVLEGEIGEYPVFTTR